MKINSRHCNVKQHDTNKKRQLFKLHFKKQNPNLSWIKNATFLQFMKQLQNNNNENHLKKNLKKYNILDILLRQ